MNININSQDSNIPHLPELDGIDQKEAIQNENVENQALDENRRSRKKVENKSPFQVFSETSAVKSQKDIVEDIANTPINSEGDCLVCFYKKGPTEFLGNFADCPNGVTIWGETFKNSEAAFQWRKFFLAATEKNPALFKDHTFVSQMEKFKTCTGEEAFQLRKYFDQNYPGIVVKGWSHGIRDAVMWDVLNAKFNQNPELMVLLKATGEAYLMEHNQAARDDYWSDNHDGSGKNMLGKMLMALRDGTPPPKPNDSSDSAIIQEFAKYANQPGALKYRIY